jgi:tRNA (adenine37-N6)-methyltransferase
MFTIEPVAHVRGGRDAVRDDAWGGSEVCIELADGFDAAALAGIETFSHVEVLFVFDRVDPATVVRDARHPRNNPDWPLTGIFAQRGKNRPNRLGSTIVRVLRREGRRLYVAELDAVDGTPVVDIKPVLREFLPRAPVTQPAWCDALMRDYWRHPG